MVMWWPLELPVMMDIYGDNSGHALVYENQGGNWAQIGSDIDGEAVDDEFGWSVSLSSDGSVLVVGAVFNNGNGYHSGHVRVYENQSGSWVQVGSDIDGEAAGDATGNSVSLSSGGNVLAIGAHHNDGNGSDAGHVRVFQLNQQQYLIPDTNFRMVVNEHLGYQYPESLIHNTTAEEMATLTSITGNNRSIESIEGAQYISNLTFLMLIDNSIDDLVPLSGLTSLTKLYLSSNSISDLSSLSGLTSLTWLSVGGNLISDLSPLAELNSLTVLSLSGNSISDLSPLSGLTSLTSLYLYENSIEDLSPISGLTSLIGLNLYRNSIEDLSPISGLTSLTFLDLWDNSIVDISPLSGLTNLISLDLGCNFIVDISQISGLSVLERLLLHSNSISDVSALTGLVFLTDLYLGYNSISDLSPISGLTSLTSLGLDYNTISDIYPLVENNGIGDSIIDQLSLSGNPLSREALEVHIPILENRIFDELHYPDNYNPQAPCFPEPERYDTNNLSSLTWQGNFNQLSGLTYDIYLGTSIDDLTLQLAGLSDTSLAVNLVPNQEYWWRVESIHNGDTLYGGVWGFLSEVNPHFTPIWSGNPLNPMSITITKAELDNLALQPGDEIGIFDGDYCVGAEVLQESIDVNTPNTYVYIACAQDDPDTPEIDGFTVGNTISYRVYDLSEEFESASISVVYPYAPQYDFTEFIINETNIVQLNAMSSITQTTDLSSGWNLVSWNISPEDMNIQNMLQSLIDNNELVKVIDQNGDILQHMPWGWVNNIGDMANPEGYQIKVSSDCQLSNEGAAVELPLTIPLISGFNLIGWPAQSEEDAETAFADIISSNQLLKVIDENGNILQHMPWGWVNNIGNLLPGEGYQVKVSSGCSLIVNEPSSGGKALKADTPQSILFQPQNSGNPYNPMAFAIQLNNNLPNGAELAVFEGDRCLGAAVVAGEYLYLSAGMDEAETTEIEGFTEGRDFSFRYRTAEMSQSEMLSIAYLEGDKTFAERGTFVGELKEATGNNEYGLNELRLFQNQPNPFHEYSQIGFDLPENGNVKLEIIGLSGKTIRVLHEGELNAGRHNKEINAANWPAGMYYCRLSFIHGNEVQIKVKRILIY